MPNPKKIGDISESAAMLELTKLGYTVLTPFGDREPYDFIVDNDGEFIRVQSKSGSIKDGAVVSYLGRSTRVDGEIEKSYYSPDEVDLFTIYCSKNDTVYAIDVEDAPKTRVTFRLNEAESTNQYTKVAQEYEITERFK